MKRPLLTVWPLALALSIAAGVAMDTTSASAQTTPTPRLTRPPAGARLAPGKADDGEEGDGSTARKKKSIPPKRGAAAAVPSSATTGPNSSAATASPSQGATGGSQGSARPSGRTRPAGSQDSTAGGSNSRNSDASARPSSGAQPSGRTRPATSAGNSPPHTNGTAQGNARPSGRTRPAGAARGPSPNGVPSPRAGAPQGSPRPTGRTRSAGHQGPSAGGSRTVVRTAGVPINSRPSSGHSTHTTQNNTEIHNYYDTPGQGYVRQGAPPAAAPPAPEDDLYLSVGLGMHGLQQPQIASESLTGPQLSVALGKKGRLIATELGVHGSRWNPVGAEEGEATITMLGASADLKLQPSLGSIEPSVLAGVGAYGIEDLQLNENALAGAFRLGVGLDMRIWEVALGARYVFSYLAFMGQSEAYNQVSGQSESFGVNLAIYF